MEYHQYPTVTPTHSKQVFCQHAVSISLLPCPSVGDRRVEQNYNDHETIENIKAELDQLGAAQTTHAAIRGILW